MEMCSPDIWGYTLNNIGSLEETLQYYYHATPGEPLQCSQGLHGINTKSFFLKNLYCLECIVIFTSRQ